MADLIPDYLGPGEWENISLRMAVQSACKIQPERGHDYWAAIAVISRVIDGLQVCRDMNTAQDARSVKRLEDLFTAIIKRAIAEGKSKAA